MPALWRPRIIAPGSVTTGKRARQRVDARLAARPARRVEHGVADEIDRQVSVVRELRQHARALADRQPVLLEAAREAAHELVGDDGMTAGEEHEQRRRIGQRARARTARRCRGGS